MNKNIEIISIAIILGLFVLSACSTRTPQPVTAAPTTTRDRITIANPASAYCEEQGFKLELRTAQDGSQYGVCMFEDDSECEEWSYYRGECKPGDTDVASPPTATPAGIANPASAYCAEQGGTSEIPRQRTVPSPACAYSPMEASAMSGLSSEDHALHELQAGDLEDMGILVGEAYDERIVEEATQGNQHDLLV